MAISKPRPPSRPSSRCLCGNRVCIRMTMNPRRDALAIFKSALAAANPAGAVQSALSRRRDLNHYKNIYVVGAGKASGTMARAVEKFLGSKITGGAVIVKDG